MKRSILGGARTSGCGSLRSLLAWSAIALLTFGCATDPSQSTATPEPKEYVTGSHVPRRDRSQHDVTVLDQNAIEEMRRTSPASASRNP